MSNKSEDYQQQLEHTRQIWDKEAASFDNEADHGLREPHVRNAWKALLDRTVSQSQGAVVLDIGCGTGTEQKKNAVDDQHAKGIAHRDGSAPPRIASTAFRNSITRIGFGW